MKKQDSPKKQDLLSKRFVFFGGKGGVGKTSIASALGVYAAKKGIKTLIISTDPAHSLADCLDQEIGGEIVQIRQVQNLWGLEIDTERATKEYGSLLMQTSAGGDEGNLLKAVLGDDISGLNPPGADEAVAFLKLIEYIEKPTHDLLIFDTAPTGHTLKLLALPQMMDNWLFRMISLRQRMASSFKAIKRLFGGGQQEEGDLKTALEGIRSRVEKARLHLQNADETEFVPITIPTLMSIWETERLLQALREFKIHCGRILVNQVNPENDNCPYCQVRYKQQTLVISDFEDLYANEFRIRKILMSIEEIRGIARLEEFGNGIFPGLDLP